MMKTMLIMMTITQIHPIKVLVIHPMRLVMKTVPLHMDTQTRSKVIRPSLSGRIIQEKRVTTLIHQTGEATMLKMVLEVGIR